ncbi:snaclec bothroinsularin subunit beta-like [Vanacampus margaritifer]
MTFALGSLLFICGINQLVIATSAVVGFPFRGDRCPPDWVQLNNRCFLLPGQSLPFEQAENACKRLGGNLVSIQSDLELAVVNELTTLTLDAKGVWIGLSSPEEEGAPLRWTDGSDTEFANSQFPGPVAAGCVAIQTNDLVWDVESCDTSQPYVCGRDIYQCVSICAQPPVDLQSPNPDDPPQ